MKASVRQRHRGLQLPSEGGRLSEPFEGALHGRSIVAGALALILHQARQVGKKFLAHAVFATRQGNDGAHAALDMDHELIHHAVPKIVPITREKTSHSPRLLASCRVPLEVSR